MRLDPDPMRAPGTDDIFPSAEYVDGYDAGFEDAEHARPRYLHIGAFWLGLIVGMIAAMAGLLAMVRGGA